MEGDRHEVWNVTLTHESKDMRSDEREREQKMMREVSGLFMTDIERAR